ncbi:MAG: hypothetical protein PHD15_02695 [Clostridia bacterium]|nr:hypothetical protein [Clostridia bacterium]MDD4386654.1 hypothetical protein [Clostridia bacterium]
MKIQKERAHSSDFKGVLKKYFSFYNKNLRKKHIIVFILSLVFFTVFMTNFINNLDQLNQLLTELSSTQEQSNIFMTIVKEKIPLVFLFIFSGITPYAFIPVVGIIGYPYILATEIINMSGFNMVLACIGSIIQIFGVSLAIAAGIYYCTCSSKKFRYSQSITFGLDDVKQQIYETTKNEVKLNKIKEKRQIKKEKREKLNIKIEYKGLIITAMISTIIVVTAALITGV